MPARSTCWRNVCWLILTSTLLTACQSLDLFRTDMSSETEMAASVTGAAADSTCEPQASSPGEESRVVTRTEVIYQPVSLDNKLVIGAVEAATFPGLDNLVMEARIDTGATTSSLHITSSRIFERDGSRWVSFTMPVAGQEDITIERPLVRSVLIKRKGAESQARPVVVMSVRVGKLSRTSEFTLTNRDSFEFPVLIGRNFLTDVAIVDVSHEYLASQKP